MKTPRLLVLLLAALLPTLAPRPAQAEVKVSFDFFYDSLSPHGEWIDVGDYGLSWRPTGMDRDWTPYSDGYWTFTDAGWTWVSYEDFGDIVYHYGRWIFAEDDGWCWVPDYEWGPAWVSWRHSEEHVGWAPLPPEARWRRNSGFSVWVDNEYDIGPGYYSFCRSRDFGAPVLRSVIINRWENVTIIRTTVNITNITYVNHGGNYVIFNGGLDYRRINERCDRRVPTLKLVRVDEHGDRDDRGRRGRFGSRIVGNQLMVAAPLVAPLDDKGKYQDKVKKIVNKEKVSRGWSEVKNDEVRKELKKELQRQTRGQTPESAPAKAIAASDLEVVPKKGDAKASSPVTTRGEKSEKTRKNAEDVAVGEPTETTRTAKEKGREKASENTRQGENGRPEMKPFNPVAETDPSETPGEKDREKADKKAKAAVGNEQEAVRMREAQDDQRANEAARRAAKAEQERMRASEEAARQQKKQMEAQQKAERQRTQADQERRGREESENAERMQRKQMEQQQRALEEQRRRSDQNEAAQQQRRMQDAQREQQLRQQIEPPRKQQQPQQFQQKRSQQQPAQPQQKKEEPRKEGEKEKEKNKNKN